jgi:hypothetical protein
MTDSTILDGIRAVKNEAVRSLAEAIYKGLPPADADAFAQKFLEKSQGKTLSGLWSDYAGWLTVAKLAPYLNTPEGGRKLLDKLYELYTTNWARVGDFGDSATAAEEAVELSTALLDGGEQIKFAAQAAAAIANAGVYWINPPGQDYPSGTAATYAAQAFCLDKNPKNQEGNGFKIQADQLLAMMDEFA